MPTAPVPPKRSSTRVPSIQSLSMLNKADFARSVIGRVLSPGTLISLRPLARPVITRMPAPSWRCYLAHHRHIPFAVVEQAEIADGGILKTCQEPALLKPLDDGVLAEAFLAVDRSHLVLQAVDCAPKLAKAAPRKRRRRGR